MKLISTRVFIVILFIASNLSAQINDQDEMQKRIFSTNYYIQKIGKFKGKIEVIDSLTFKFDDKILTFESSDPSIKFIFTYGILYPEVIHQALQATIVKDGKEIENVKLKPENNMTTSSKSETIILDDLVGVNNLNFGNFKELHLEGMPFKKRFSFWLSRKKIVNPEIYYFELTNENATKETSMEAFIRGARLSVLRAGGVIF